jgi:hypothetical protein
MSRTTRALPHDVKRESKTYEDYCAEWVPVYRGRNYARRSYSYNNRLGRDGGYKSLVYSPMKWAPGFIDRWREDGVEGPRLKRSAKRELVQMRRRDGKRQIARALYLGDER